MATSSIFTSVKINSEASANAIYKAYEAAKNAPVVSSQVRAISDEAGLSRVCDYIKKKATK